MTLQLQARSIVGTGDPIDGIMLIPLRSQWGAARACGLVQDEEEPECEAMIQRIVILEASELGPGGTSIALCEAHFQKIRGKVAATS